jgi:hypothetical protein
MDTFVVRIWSESPPAREPDAAPDAAPEAAPDAGEAPGYPGGATPRRRRGDRPLRGIARHVRTGAESRFTEPGELIAFLASQPAGERDTDAPAVDVPAAAGAPADPPAGPALGRDRP